MPAFLARRRELAAHYLDRLAGHELLDVPVVEPRADPAWHFAFVQLRLDRLRVDRGTIFQALRAEGIGVNVHYIPVHRHRYYRERFPGVSMPVAEAAYERLLTIPLYPGDDGGRRRRRRRGAGQGHDRLPGGVTMAIASMPSSR